MSYTLEPYAIEIEELKQAVGSKRTELVDAAIKSDPESFEDDDDDEDDDELALSDALRGLIHGDMTDAESPHQYGYALKVLANHLGEMLEFDWWCGVRWAAMEETGLDKVIEQSGCPVTLPPNPGTFPTIGFMLKDDVIARVNELGDGHMKNDDEDLQDLLNEYENWLRTAAANKKDILFFYY